MHAPGWVPVMDATVTSQSGFNYGESSTSTYLQWAWLYQVGATSMAKDYNNNGVSNYMEYALGLDPPSSSSEAPPPVEVEPTEP